jgi:hypothetical protein
MIDKPNEPERIETVIDEAPIAIEKPACTA